NVYYSDYEANSIFFEDHGESFAYEQDIYLEKKFVVNGDENSLTMEHSMEGLYTPRYDGYLFNVIGLPFMPAKIIIDGKEVTDFAVNNDKILKFKYTKTFKHIEIKK
ncbi:MAG: DUF5110 domain-containing protein, partial [Sphingobacteriaceae bacterium]